MNIRIITEAKEDTVTDKIKAAATEYTGTFQSVRRGATKGQREQSAKANKNPGGLLQDLGMSAVGGKDNIIKNFENVILGFLSGTKRKELKSVFGRPEYAKDVVGKIGVFVPLTKIAMDAVRVASTSAAREFAFWLHSVLWAAHKTKGILGNYADSTARQRLRVDFGQSGFIIYFSLNGWNKE